VPHSVAIATETANATTNEVHPLPLPNIPGLLIIPDRIKVVLALGRVTTDGITFGLSHNTGLVVGEINEGQNSFLNSWWWHHWEVDLGEPFVLEDLRPYRVRLAGPQTVITANAGSVNLFWGLRLWYHTEKVGSLEWAQVASITSFEDEPG